MVVYSQKPTGGDSTVFPAVIIILPFAVVWELPKNVK